MTNAIRLLGLSLFIFIFFTLLTMKIETVFDGPDTYGFPLTFHIKWSGECDPCPEKPTETYIGYLLIDLVLAGALAFGIQSLFSNRKKRN